MKAQLAWARRDAPQPTRRSLLQPHLHVTAVVANDDLDRPLATQAVRFEGITGANHKIRTAPVAMPAVVMVVAETGDNVRAAVAGPGGAAEREREKRSQDQ